MTTRNPNTRGLDALEKDILNLRRKARKLETRIDENFTYFQHHSGSMFVRSLLPRKIAGETLTDNPVLDAFLQNERIQKILARLADKLADKLGNGLNWLADRVFRKD
jgi:hypothetical protein